MAKRSNLFGGNTNFKTSLAISTIVLGLLFLFILSQILKLQSSGDAIVTNLKETKKINTLLSNLILVEEKFDDGTLNIKLLDSVKAENKSILQDLEKKKDELSNFIGNQREFYNIMELNLFDRDSLDSSLSKPLLKRTKDIKKELLKWYSEEIESSTIKFEQDNAFFSYVFILSTIIGFSILGLSVLKIIEARATINEKSGILDSILENTNDIANFYEPIYNEKNEIVDFRISYASKSNLSLTHLPYKDLIGANASVAYPFLKTTQLFNQLVSAFKNQEYFEKTIEAPIKNKVRYYKSRFVPVKGGLQVMITELTNLYVKQQQLEKINSELSLSNRLFHEAEEVAQLGSFVRYTEQEISLFSENIFRILGLKPQSIKMSSNNFREFVHPEDLSIYDEAFKNTDSNDEPVELTFRVKTVDDKIKHLFSRCVYGTRDGESIMVGVMQDVSNKIKNEKKLKQQNLELLRQNKELDSFNRVASHDLQEPLRKIQMFISRINESEKNTFGERSQNYFNKIENAATRMRGLINKLLAFSRIDNKDYKFETVDLKDVFNNVLDTFSEVDAKIIIDDNQLPTLSAIPFLMEQLFTNLISNGIKYKTKDTNSIIKVVISNKVSKKEISQKFDKRHAFYHKFEIIDNGIGFDNKESKKIFNLFYRLHSKSDYSGTGLGLAICEKIVSKHQGFIFASAEIDKGATFTVYLPAK